jgi:DNA-binding response OmpR family regulator
MATKIMVVDDEPAIGKLLFYQLSGFGYQVSYIENGLQALQRLTAERPDLVLLDVMMPLISGWEICRQIRACSQVPVIMLTAKSADLDIVTGLQAGADDYITKPFSMTQLQARIEAVLRRTKLNTHNSHTPRSAFRPDPPAPASAAPRHEPTRAIGSAVLYPQEPVVATPLLRLGQHMRETRLSRGMSLHQVERVCNVRWEFLQAIEQENWDYVPREELRRSLRTYAAYLAIDLPALIGQPKPRRKPQLFPLQFAAALALVMVLLVVGMYLL